jgi:hypothetical protein
MLSIAFLSKLFVGAVLLGLSKAVADTVAEKPLWDKSIFNKIALRFNNSYENAINSWWGCKDFTWTRKDKENKILNYLFHNQLVGLTDIWHFANTVRSVSTIYILFIILNVFLSFIPAIAISVLTIVLSQVNFVVLYNWVFRGKNNTIKTIIYILLILGITYGITSVDNVKIPYLQKSVNDYITVDFNEYNKLVLDYQSYKTDAERRIDSLQQLKQQSDVKLDLIYNKIDSIAKLKDSIDADNEEWRDILKEFIK